MRARNIKPGLFKNELLASSGPLNTVIFCGLWCMADREGRLEDRPRRIHMEVNPCRPVASTALALQWLDTHGFIHRYSVGTDRYIQVTGFSKHQNPHTKEPKSTIPAPGDSDANTRSAPYKNESGPASSLIPDSGYLIPDPPTPISASRGRVGDGTSLEEREAEARAQGRDIWALRDAPA